MWSEQTRFTPPRATESQAQIVKSDETNPFCPSLGIPQQVEDAVQLLQDGNIATADAARFLPDRGQPRSTITGAQRMARSLAVVAPQSADNNRV